MVSSPRNRERAAASEVRYFIGDLLNDPDIKIHQTRISGLLTCKTTLDPFDVVHELQKFADDNPYQFRFAIKFVPIETCVETDLDAIVDAARNLSSKISEEDSFRVTVRSRHTTLDNMLVIEAVAAEISRRVDLDHPDWTVWIEIVGETTGLSVLRVPDDILSIMTLRDNIY